MAKEKKTGLHKIAENELDMFFKAVRLEFAAGNVGTKEAAKKIGAKLDTLYDGVESFGEKDVKDALKALS